MLKFVEAKQTFREVPDEVCLSISLSNCPGRCEGCHSPELREDIGEELTSEVLDKLIEENPGISCVVLLGGDGDLVSLDDAAHYVQEKHHLKVAWYSGRSIDLIGLEEEPDGQKSGLVTLPKGIDQRWFTYFKFGPYIEECGALDKETTNQHMLENLGLSSMPSKAAVRDITWKFWTKAWK